MQSQKFKFLMPILALVCCAGFLLIAAGQTPPQKANKSGDGQELIPRDEEIALALSAAPEHLRQDATVYVLERNRYVKVREGSNGFSCLVVRFGNMIAPYAYDKEGSETLMLADFRRAELVAGGKSLKEAQKILVEEFESGKLLAPRKPGVAYMLSPDFVQRDSQTGKETQVFPPHVMFYAPFVKNSDIGALPEHFNSQEHVFVLNEGRPDAMFIIVPQNHH